jgi:hypothetical protein
MPLDDLKITVNDREYRIRRTILSEEPTRYRLLVLDADSNEQLNIEATSPWSGSFIETDVFLKKFVEDLIMVRDDEQVG